VFAARAGPTGFDPELLLQPQNKVIICTSGLNPVGPPPCIITVPRSMVDRSIMYLSPSERQSSQSSIAFDIRIPYLRVALLLLFFIFFPSYHHQIVIKTD